VRDTKKLKFFLRRSEEPNFETLQFNLRNTAFKSNTVYFK